MKVLLINGSPHEFGCTYTALKEIEKTLNKELIDTEILWIGNKPIAGCIACMTCKRIHKCIFNEDKVNKVIEDLPNIDGIVVGSPVYYAGPSGQLCAFLDRLFYAGSAAFAFKPAAAVVSARRAGTTASLDAIIKHFTINQMPVISSNYWCMTHGAQNSPEQAKQDLEGMQIMRVLGQNMAWILKCIDAGKKAGISHPQTEDKIMTNFIR